MIESTQKKREIIKSRRKYKKIWTLSCHSLKKSVKSLIVHSKRHQNESSRKPSRPRRGIEEGHPRTSGCPEST